jgi:PAS domain S-box-containing protein
MSSPFVRRMVLTGPPSAGAVALLAFTMDPRLQKPGDEAALRLVVEGTVSETGTDFFRALVRNLAAVMGTAGAWVTEYLPERRHLRPHAFWLRDRFIDFYEHPIDGTPCEAVLTARKLVHYPDRILDLYPNEADLREFNAVSYMGVPLFDLDGTIMGHLAVLDTQPLPPEPRLISLFEIFAARAAAEQRRLKMEQQVRAREEELSAVLASAMDAIIVLDDRLLIVRANPAAERLFGCSSEDLLGESFRDFLDDGSATRLNAFLQELDARSSGERQLWIPQSFTARRWDHSTFPAEATLSRFENRGRVFHSLILRNVNDRLEAEQRIHSLSRQAEYLWEELKAFHQTGEILGQSPALRRALEDVRQVAPTEAAVLIQGETGTGKELFARAIHNASRRRDKPLITVNCAAIPASLIESEFFGHEKGAFTGATARRDGRFAMADGGTLFLDEVGELPLDLQGKLLRVLQEGTFEPVGSSVSRKVDVRVVAATNRELEREVKEGKFRGDLFYRLNVFPILIPPLRERGQDVVLLASAFAQRFARRMGRSMEPLSQEEACRLQAYPWPGNVRELANVIERAVITAAAGRLNLARALPEGASSPPFEPLPTAGGSGGGVRTVRELEALERANLIRALEQCQWRVSGDNGAAQLLGMNSSTLSSRMKVLGVKRPS